MGKIIIDQYIPCDSFPVAKTICNAFADLKIKECYFGENQTIKASRFIRRIETDHFSHYAIIRYSIKFKGEFCSYGFIDYRSIKRHSDLPKVIENCPVDDRYKIIREYEEKDDYWYDIYYYKNFEEFYKSEIIDLLRRIDLACKVSFLCEYHTDFFEIFYEECGKVCSRGYWANMDNRGLSLFGTRNAPDISFSPISLQSIWDWSQENYYDKKSGWYAEARAWASLSYALNRDGYESLLYSIMALEAVYTKGDKKIKQQLKEVVPKVIACINENEIDELYKLRSEFVHGNIAFPMYGRMDKEYSKYKLVQKATFILLETIRLLVQKNATKIVLSNGKINYIQGRTLCDDMKKKSFMYKVMGL